MTEFVNPTYILPAVTELTYPRPGIIKNITTIDKVVDSMGGYEDLGMVIEPDETAGLIKNNKEEFLEAYNLSGILKE